MIDFIQIDGLWTATYKGEVIAFDKNLDKVLKAISDMVDEFNEEHK